MSNATNIKEFLTRHVLCNGSKLLSEPDKEQLRFLRKEKNHYPFILLSYSTQSKIAGADRISSAISNHLKTNNYEAKLLYTGSMGFFSLEPVVQIQLPGKTRMVFHSVNDEMIPHLIDSVFNHFIPEEHFLGQLQNEKLESWDGLPFLENQAFFAKQRKIVSRNCGFIDPYSIEEYIAHGGFRSFCRTIRQHTFQEVCDIVEKSGLRGRGGSGYYTGKKWKTALSQTSDQKYLICNADESDPGSFTERFLAEGDPFRVIEGIAISAYAIDANKAFIYIRNRYHLAIKRLQNAINQAREYGILGHNIFDSGFNLNIEIKKGSGAFVCGEETALIRSLEGKRGMPYPRPPYPAQKGLFNKPTVINNIETLCFIPDITFHGAGWFKTIGKENNRGTKIIGLSGKIKNTGVAEIPLGIKLNEIIEELGEGTKNNTSLKAIHIGGPGGGSVPASQVATSFDYDSLKKLGALMGSASLVVLDDQVCMVDWAKYYMNFIRKESCGKCIPCREGANRMYEILDNITKRLKNDTNHHTLTRFKGVIQLESLAETMQDTALCGLGRSAANPVLSTLRWFREEYEDHIFDRYCQAGVCKELRRFYINVDQCTGCKACADKCPANAIVGTKRHPFFIVEEKCTGCGTCYETCKFNAISII